jgi:hypothetical protein
MYDLVEKLKLVDAVVDRMRGRECLAADRELAAFPFPTCDTINLKLFSFAKHHLTQVGTRSMGLQWYYFFFSRLFRTFADTYQKIKSLTRRSVQAAGADVAKSPSRLLMICVLVRR